MCKDTENFINSIGSIWFLFVSFDGYACGNEQKEVLLQNILLTVR